MKKFSNITTLIFDLGGVLVNLDLAGCIENFKALGVENFEKYLSNFGQKGFFLQFEKGQISVEQFRDEVRKLSAQHMSDDQIDKAWSSFLCDIPVQKLDILLKLKPDFRLLLLSNTNPLHITTTVALELAKTGNSLSGIFDKCYFSYEMGMAKPDREIFEAVLADAGVLPGECLFLDDGPKNIEQAAKLGIQTYLVAANEDLSWLVDRG